MRLRLSRLLGAVPAAVAIVWACLLCCGVPAAAARPHTYPLPQPHQLSAPASLVSDLVVLLFAAAIVAFVVLRTRGRRHATTAPVEPLPAAAKPAQRRKAA